MNDALRPFVNQSSSNVTDPDSKQSVDKYRIFLTRVVDSIPKSVDCRNRAKQYWSGLAKKSKSVRHPDDDLILRVIAEAGEKWLTSGNANLDVRRILPNHRARLFQVGEVDDPDAETLVRGKTFVPSRDVKPIATELTSLLHFIARHKPGLIETQLKEAHSIYSSKMDYRKKEEDAKSDAADSMIDSNIIFGIVITAVLDPPAVTNGATTIDHFLR